ncbi:MAG TPA: BTAD domain-containing putative transcriptional regulator [Actinophytocola sp.]|uniref:AfsR/SARP family transcriptional regulator n=1 Tax=Actinophytocola sp. TaxID=1872138 RepID=UPI002DB8E4FC|nr:BTAD domain-containing putative transcriptional regulator [Actinophytocola sp.]HEU5473373.1 BTAD domain-containing putative transcriptional regulator [Actinophytocola sp.]
MRLRLLGPLELVSGDRSLDLGGPRQRIVLAVLGLNANRVVPVDVLVDAVWGTGPPTTARSQIQICISALRKVFSDGGQPGAISTRPPGYLLRLDPAALDTLEFDAWLAAAREHSGAGRTEQAAATLRRALALWSGTALSGVSGDVVARAATALAERRLAAIEERIQLDLALGRQRELVGELQELVAEHPLRERLHGFLMLALYRTGRQAEALEAGRRARAVLVEEVGVDPGPELRELEQAILRGEPEAPATSSVESSVAAAPVVRAAGPEVAVVPKQLPASIADFTGRAEQLREIKRVLGEDRESRWGMPIVAISGKGGVGKSSLAARAAHELSAHYPDGQLYADLGARGDDDHTAKLLARFLRALGVAGTAVPDDVEERGELYRSLLSGKRLLLVLDDVSSEAQVAPLMPGSPSCAVIATSRARLSGLPGAHRIDVDVLDAEQSVELLTRIVGAERVAAERPAVVELAELCGGLPLALRIAGARLASRPHWRPTGLVHRLRDEARRLDEFAHHGLELRSNIGLTHRLLSEPARRLLRRCALMRAPDFPAWTAAALLDTTPAAAEEVLESLVDAQLVDVVQFPDAAPRYRLHDLIRVYAAEKLHEGEPEAARVAALRRVLGGWLALAEEAHRREYGGDFTILHGGATRWRPALAAVAETAAGAGSADWWEGERRALVAAVRQAAEAGLDELCWDLALTSVTLFESKGYFDDWLECAQLALDTVRRAGNRIGMAAALYSLGTLHMFQTRVADAAECFAGALEIFRAEGVRHGCALVLRNAAHLDGLRGDIGAMRAKYTESLDIMREVGDRIGEAHILRSTARSRLDEGDTATAERLLDEALVICRETGCLRVEAQVVHRFAELYLATDQIDLARQALHRVLRIVRDTGDRIGEVYALYGLGILRHRESRLDNAETTLVHALELARRLGERLIEAKSRYSLGEIALARGETAGAAAHLLAAARLFEEQGAAAWHTRALTLVAGTRTHPTLPNAS